MKKLELKALLEGKSYDQRSEILYSLDEIPMDIKYKLSPENLSDEQFDSIFKELEQLKNQPIINPINEKKMDIKNLKALLEGKSYDEKMDILWNTDEIPMQFYDRLTNENLTDKELNDIILEIEDYKGNTNVRYEEMYEKEAVYEPGQAYEKNDTGEEKSQYDLLKEYWNRTAEFLNTYELKEEVPLNKFDIMKIGMMMPKVSKETLMDILKRNGSDITLTEGQLKNPVIIKTETLNKIIQNFNENSFSKKEFIKWHQEKLAGKEAYLEQVNQQSQYVKKEVLEQIAKIDPIYAVEQFGFKVNGKQPSGWQSDLNNGTAKGIRVQSPEGENFLVYSTRDTKDFIFISTDEGENKFKGNLVKLTVEKILNLGPVKNNPKGVKEAVDTMQMKGILNGVPSQYTYSQKENQAKVKLSERSPVLETKLNYPIYLLSRGISMKTLSNKLFINQIGQTTDKNKDMNIAFIYKNQQDLMTYQEVNKGNKGYFQSGVSTNGVLFMSDTESPSKIVIGESPIDVLSYAELKGIDNDTLYIASGGFMNNLQLKHIEEIIEKNDIKKISLATDMDLQGEIYRHQIAKLLINKEINKIQNTIDVGQATASQMNRLTVFQEIENGLSEATPYLSKVKSIEKYNGMFSNDDELKTLRTEGLSKINEHAFKKLKDYKEFYVDNLQSKNKDFNEDLMSSKNLTREDIQKSEVNPNMTSKILYEMEVSKNMSIQDILQSQKDSKSIER